LGQVKNVFIKNLAKRLIEKYPDKFTKDFDKNKDELDRLIRLESKKIRNKVAGYLVHQIKKRESPSFETPYHAKREKGRGRRRRRGRRR
jgi:small subunit ribosomal protein S17e